MPVTNSTWIVIGSCAFAAFAYAMLRFAVGRSARKSAAPRHVDALTGLPDRVALAEEAHQALSDAEHRSAQLALFVVNVDRLKPINDSLGHHIGDELLLEVSRR